MTDCLDDSLLIADEPNFCARCGTDMGPDAPYGICGRCEAELMGWEDDDGLIDDDDCLDCCPKCGTDYCTWNEMVCTCFKCGYIGK